ncbi:hypothetical protein ACWCPQ_09385 [Nocardia sp. NPDC001965]
MPGDEDDWHSIVRALFYHIQFEPLLDESTARGVAENLLRDPLWDLSPDEEHRILSAGLRLGYPLPTSHSAKNGERELRNFLEMTVRCMDEMRPWPVPPFRRLPEERLGDFVSLIPIARTNRPVNDLEEQIGQLFDYEESYGEFLLVQLEPGIEVGLLNSLGSPDETADIVSTGLGVTPAEILDRLAEATGLARKVFED